MEIVKIIAEELQISEQQVQTVIEMIDEGLTIPFIARYRKEVTGSLNDEVLRAFDTRLTYLRNLDERMNTVINSIEEQGLLTEELKAQVLACKTMTELEDVYRPYKPKKKTRASVAKEKGLEPLAKYILAQKEEKPLIEYAKEFINEEKKVTSVAEAIQGALDIIAEIVADDADYRKRAKKIFFEFGKIVTKENIRDEKGTFDMYKDYQEPIAKIASHRVLAINRGENMKCLKVTFDLPHDDILDYIKKKIIIANSPFGSELSLTIEDAYKRLILPSIESEIRNELTEKAEDSSIVVFKENLHQLLLVAPVKHKVVLGFDPGFAHGCKLAVVDENGKVLDTGVVYPTPPRNQIDLSKKIVGAMILKHKINVVAIGNGTASRESQAFIKELLQELADKHQCTFTVVSEAGASIYS
ncbi:MAG: RNA-binding transcriptional accessory protein, partial [Bacilli bacterium]|nr:RNA-binding transcriptional accessory protein [Bacilli bacterium]